MRIPMLHAAIAAACLSLPDSVHAPTKGPAHAQRTPSLVGCAFYPDVPYYPESEGSSCGLPTLSACEAASIGNTHCLDVRVPSVVLPDSPTIVFVHGGGWSGGDKNHVGMNGYSESAFLEYLCVLGYRVVSCNYALACDDASTPDVYDAPSYPQAILDVRAVIGWIRTYGWQSPYDLSDCIVVTGISAGGQLAAMAGALSMNNAVFTPPEYSSADLSVRLVIPISADFDLFRRGCRETSCACSAPFEPHLAQFGNDTITQPFVGATWQVGYMPVDCPIDGWNYLDLSPGEFTLDPFLDASPTHWMTPTSAPLYMLHSECDEFFPTIETAWMAQAASLSGVATAAEIAPSGHGLRMFGDAGTASKVDEIIRTWTAYERCP